MTQPIFIHECRIRTPKQIVRSLSKKRPGKNKSSVEEEIGLGGLGLEEADDQPQSSVLIIKELDQDQSGTEEKGEDSHHREEVADLNNSLEEMKNELAEFKRTSSMERDALRKELDVMKGIDASSQPYSEEGKSVAKVETLKDSEKDGATGMFCGIFEDDGFIKCCLPG